MIVANRATLSGIIRTSFLSLPGKGLLAALITISASTCHRRYWALVGSELVSSGVPDAMNAPYGSDIIVAMMSLCDEK